jgi:SAM-dependent methyltransferase
VAIAMESSHVAGRARDKVVGDAVIERTIKVVPPPQRRAAAYSQWVSEACRAESQVLNIGAGRNVSDPLKAVTGRGSHLVGIDPDDAIHYNDALDERYQVSMEEFAVEHRARFDVAFSLYVLEHVEHPEAFIAACGYVLKPGGLLFGLTLNRYQYFGFVTWMATRLGISEVVLKRLKTPEQIAGYHFPTQYRLNSIGTLTRRLDQAGFRSVEFRCFDQPRRYASYLPRSMKGFAYQYSRAAYAVGKPSLMGHLSFAAVR